MFSLTPEQRAVVASDAHALEVRAGAGSGKTLALAHRVARFGVDARAQSRMLVVTFTRDATAQLQRRLSLLLGRSHYVRVTSFHQWAARELPPGERQFLGESEARKIVMDALRRRGTPAGFVRAVGAAGEDADIAVRVLGVISHAKNAGTGLTSGSFGGLAPWEDLLQDVRDTYEARKGDLLDFDDVLIHFRDRLARSPTFRRAVREKLDHIFVDEYQDVNAAQAEAVRVLTTNTRSVTGAPSVTVVGDARQSIYAFRGGSPKHLDAFLAPYGRSGKRLALTTNFRSTRALVSAANRAIAQPEGAPRAAPAERPMRASREARHGAAPRILACEDGEGEAFAAVNRVAELLAAGTDAAEIVILARARHLARSYQDEVAARIADETYTTGEAYAAACEARAAGTPCKDERAKRVLERRAAAAGIKPRAPLRALLALARQEDLQRVAVSTIHAAKGLEWDHVILLGAYEGGLPGAPSLYAPEEERADLLAEEQRLCYVAVTRPRKTLLATWPLRIGRRDLAVCRWLAPFQEMPVELAA